jgi:hypothetical protein
MQAQNKNDKTDINELLRDAQQSVVVDRNELLNRIFQNHTDETLKTMDEISDEIREILYETLSHETASSEIESYCQKLIGYCYVDAMSDLRQGRHIRWLNTSTMQGRAVKLAAGGILVNIKYGGASPILVCKTANGRFFNVNFDNCIVFQQMQMDEQAIREIYAGLT